MSIIGDFAKTEDGYTGTIRTLTIVTRARILPSDRSGNDKAPDWRVYVGEVEIGAGWTTRPKDPAGREYINLKLDDPSFPAPIRANLFEKKGHPGEHELIWSRPE
jgi:uncharacterized protein (DUF736 family)